MVISWASLLPGRGGFRCGAIVSRRSLEPTHQRRHTDRPQPALRDPQAEAAVIAGPPGLVCKPDRNLLDEPLVQQALQDAFECHAARPH
jgi:hypothetical protein